jgi:hypothetical protein
MWQRRSTMVPAAVSSTERRAMVLGRTNYEGLAAFWSQQTGDWADMLNPLPKSVGSRRLRGPLDWNATVIEGAVTEGVPGLKTSLRGPAADRQWGAGAPLPANGIVDDLRFWLHPAVWGEGTRPYQGETVRMRLLDSASYDSGVTLLGYGPVRP